MGLLARGMVFRFVFVVNFDTLDLLVSINGIANEHTYITIPLEA